MLEKLLTESESKMKHSIQHFQGELGKLRTGRASLALVEGIRVDYFGKLTPLAQLATLGVPDSSTVTIQPWDTSIMQVIEKAIQTADLGLNPMNDGKVIRLHIPPLTGERRQQLVKILKKSAEDGRVAIRNVRRDFNEKIKHLEKDGLSKDACHKGQDRLQKTTDQYIAEVDKIAQAREKDLLSV